MRAATRVMERAAVTDEPLAMTARNSRSSTQRPKVNPNMSRTTRPTKETASFLGLEAVQGNARQGGQDEPSDRVHGHSGSEGDLTEVAAQVAEILQNLRHHRQRRHGQRECEESREYHPFGAFADEGIG